MSFICFDTDSLGDSDWDVSHESLRFGEFQGPTVKEHTVSCVNLLEVIDNVDGRNEKSPYGLSSCFTAVTWPQSPVLFSTEPKSGMCNRLFVFLGLRVKWYF